MQTPNIQVSKYTRRKTTLLDICSWLSATQTRWQKGLKRSDKWVSRIWTEGRIQRRPQEAIQSIACQSTKKQNTFRNGFQILNIWTKFLHFRRWERGMSSICPWIFLIGISFVSPYINVIKKFLLKPPKNWSPVQKTIPIKLSVGHSEFPTCIIEA